MSGKTITLRVGCEFAYDVSAPTPVTVQVRPRSDAPQKLITEDWSTIPDLPVDEYLDIYGNPVKRLVMPEGPFVLKYDATCAVPDEPDPDGSGARGVGPMVKNGSRRPQRARRGDSDG